MIAAGDLRGLAWLSMVASGLCCAWAFADFLLLLAPTRPLTVALDAWRHDAWDLSAVTAAVVLALGGALTLTRLHRAEPWKNISRKDRALAIIGSMPVALLYYPVAVVAAVIGVVVFVCVLTIHHVTCRRKPS